KLDFVLMHSCCTGGIGSYADEVWDYTDYTTKSRARQVLGDPLPTWDRLRYNSFDALGPHVSYLKTYVGPAYFGLHDVSWSAIRGSLQPSRGAGRRPVRARWRSSWSWRAPASCARRTPPGGTSPTRAPRRGARSPRSRTSWRRRSGATRAPPPPR